MKKLLPLVLVLAFSACSGTSERDDADDFKKGNVVQTRKNEILSESYSKIMFDVRKLSPNYEFLITLRHPFTSSDLSVSKGQKLYLEIDGKSHEFKTKEGTEYVKTGGLYRTEFIKYPGVKKWVLKKMSGATQIHMRMEGRDKRILTGKFSKKNLNTIARFTKYHAR